MPPKKNTGNTASADGPSTVSLTENDLKLLDTIFKNCSNDVKPKPTASFDDLAVQLGLKSGKVVSDRYRQISNKVGWFMAEPATAGTSVPKKTPVSRKKKAVPDVDADDEASEVSPKKRKTTKKTAKTQVDNTPGFGEQKEMDEDNLDD